VRRPWSAAWIRGAALALVLGLGTGCGSDSEAAGTGGTGALDGEVVVFAAASLTDAFQELGERFEADHPGTTVTFNFAGSATLAQQIVAGAPADVFAAASPQAMAMVEEAGLAEPELFARNRLQIAVPSGNPAGVTGLADFAREELRIALCAEPAPCGAAAVRGPHQPSGVPGRPGDSAAWSPGDRGVRARRTAPSRLGRHDRSGTGSDSSGGFQSPFLGHARMVREGHPSFPGADPG